MIAQARLLVRAGNAVAIHYDARAPREEFRRIREGLAVESDIAFAPRLRCGWGSWSLVEASLRAARTALDTFPDATHFHLISGDCVPIKSAGFIRRALGTDDRDHIEAHDFDSSGWIRTGLREERLLYRHWFNERSQKALFYGALALQRGLGLSRQPPRGLSIRVGSQWWCLRRGTLEAALDFARRRPDVMRFFRTTWIPDESFFQTLVGHLVPAAEITGRPPTFLIFSDYGLPVVFHDDHRALLERQEAFFARKVAPGALALRQALSETFLTGPEDVEARGGGVELYGYLSQAGRHGGRNAPRAWEDGAKVGADREILVLVCKKWHVAERLRRQISQMSNLPSVGFLFDEADLPLPDLGGYERDIDLRRSHRRAFLRLLCDYHKADRLLICADPCNDDLLRDLARDGATVRVLEIGVTLDDDWLLGHAERVGVAPEHLPLRERLSLLPALRGDIAREFDRLRALELPRYERMSDRAYDADNARALASFLSIPEDRAMTLAAEAVPFAE